MNPHPHFALTTLAAALLLAGCAGPEVAPNYDARFGQSVRQAVALQTLNPGAGTDTAAPAAIDAQAARNALVRQRASFSSPPPSFTVLGITGGGGGSGGGQ